MHHHRKSDKKMKTNNDIQYVTYFMLNAIPLLLGSAMQVHIIPPMLHYEALKFPDALKL
jgi:hypothetical protein